MNRSNFQIFRSWPAGSPHTDALQLSILGIEDEIAKPLGRTYYSGRYPAGSGNYGH